MPTEPRPLTTEEIDSGARTATKLFVQERLAEESGPYRAAFLGMRPRVDALFKVTSDLCSLNSNAFLRQGAGVRRQLDHDAIDVARYLSAPMVSKDNLKDIQNLDLDTFEPLPPRVPVQKQAEQIAAILQKCFDPFRFPWLSEGRGPTSEERQAAIDWTASTFALERVRTDRRVSGAKSQEAAVAAALRGVGWKELPKRRLRYPNDLEPGCFTRESYLAAEKCDVPTRLLDDRLLAIECKVTNTAINSVKRILRETGGKSLKWREDFGRQVVTAIVVSGVVKPSDLARAQDEFGIFVVFEHDLNRLLDFVTSTRG